MAPEKVTTLEESLVGLGFNPEHFSLSIFGEDVFVTGWKYQNRIIVDVIHQSNGILVCYDWAAKPIIDDDAS